MVIDMFSNFNCGKRIRELRAARGLSQERLALNAGITPAYLGLVEREKRNATVVVLERICMGMDVSLSEFFSAETKDYADADDHIGKQILFLLNGLTNDEKQLVLQIVKNTITLREMNMQKENKEVPCIV